jgi:hypothetical protein
MTESRCDYVEEDSGARCQHPPESHRMLSHPMPGGPPIGLCNACEGRPTYTHYYHEDDASTSPIDPEEGT